MRRRYMRTITGLLLGLLAGCGPEGAPGEADSPPARAEPSPPEAGVPVAITIDDLPWVGVLPPGRDRQAATRRILEALEQHGAAATGFVNCGRVERDAPVLRLWLEAGMPLGNHTDHHLDLNSAPLDAWLRDARRCDTFLREVTGEPFLHFRYPYLHEGNTPERWETARRLLEELESPVAHVTIDTADWILAAAYGSAVRAGDEALAAEIGEAFLEHTLRAVRHYRSVAAERAGRQVSQVMLLHANALVSDYLDPLLDRLREEGIRFVSLEEALSDPVYQLPNDYIGPEGLSWLYRFEPAAPELAAWDDEENARLRARFPR